MLRQVDNAPAATEALREELQQIKDHVSDIKEKLETLQGQYEQSRCIIGFVRATLAFNTAIYLVDAKKALDSGY